MSMCECLNVCLCTKSMLGATEQSTESLEQELWVVVSHYVAPGIKLRFSEDQSVLSTTEAPFWKPIL